MRRTNPTSLCQKNWAVGIFFHFFHYFYQWLRKMRFCQFWPLCHTPMVDPSSPPGLAVSSMPVDSNQPKNTLWKGDFQWIKKNKSLGGQNLLFGDISPFVHPHGRPHGTSSFFSWWIGIVVHLWWCFDWSFGILFIFFHFHFIVFTSG